MEVRLESLRAPRDKGKAWANELSAISRSSSELILSRWDIQIQLTRYRFVDEGGAEWIFCTAPGPISNWYGLDEFLPIQPSQVLMLEEYLPLGVELVRTDGFSAPLPQRLRWASAGPIVRPGASVVYSAEEWVDVLQGEIPAERVPD